MGCCFSFPPVEKLISHFTKIVNFFIPHPHWRKTRFLDKMGLGIRDEHNTPKQHITKYDREIAKRTSPTPVISVCRQSSSLLMSHQLSTLMTNGGWGVLLLIAHVTNQVDCSSAMKQNSLPPLYASTA